MLRYLLMLFFILVLAGCGSNDFVQPEPTVTVMETAVSAIPSAPPIATSTLLPTKTATPQPTHTTTPIPTPTLTITPTPEPLAVPFMEEVTPVVVFRWEPVASSYPEPPLGVLGPIIFFFEGNKAHIFDISEPTNIRLLWTSDEIPGYFQSLAIVDEVVFLVVDGELYVWSIVDPVHPVEIFRKSDVTLKVSGREIHIFDSMGPNEYQIQVMELLESGELTEKRVVSATFPFSPHGVVNSYYYGIQDDHLQFFEVNSSNELNLVMEFMLPADFSYEIEQNAQNLLIATSKEITILNTDHLEQPAITFSPPVSIENMSSNGNILVTSWYMCDGHINEEGEISASCGLGIEVTDITDVSQPLYVGRLIPQTETDLELIEEIVISGKTIFFISGSNLYMFDIPVWQISE